MNEITIESFTANGETLTTEFKKTWYWTNKDKDKDIQKEWGEFLKDFSALFNVQSSDESKKHLIFGYDDDSKEFCDFHISDELAPDLIKKTEKLKDELTKRVKKHFSTLPEDKNIDLPEIDSLYQINTFEYQGKKLLAISIDNAPYILEIKKDIVDKKSTYRKNTVLIRNYKEESDPENCIASHTEISKILKLISDQNMPKRNISVSKYVNIFKSKHLPSSKLDEVSREYTYSNGNCHEVYKLNGMFGHVQFIYFSKYTSQNRIAKHLIETKIIENIKTIILVDNENRQGGSLDKSRIKDLFSKKISDIDIYTLSEFSNQSLCNDLFEMNIFHQGRFNIDDFVRPYTEKSEDKTADILLWEWFNATECPLMVLKGTGGIGKTTVVKYFLDQVSKSKNNDCNVLFINSHEIINEIINNGKIDNIFDFYKALAQKKNVNNSIDASQLELSIDNGQLIIAIDGIDEVISKLGEKFNNTEFIKTIFEKYSDNFAKAKILLTCRDYFWEDETEYSSQIKKVKLLPFDKKLTEEYFKKHFDETERQYKQAIDLAKHFALNKDDDKSYIPYILDMIKDNLFGSKDEALISESSLLNQNFTNDVIIAKSCEREIKKLDNNSIDSQVNVFLDIANKYSGTVTKEQLSKILSKSTIRNSEKNIDKFFAHPLMRSNQDSTLAWFRYDFFNDHFKCLSILKSIRDDHLENIDEHIQDIFTSDVQYGGFIEKELFNRLKSEDINSSDIKDNIWIFIESLKSDEMEIQNKKLVSSLFLFLLTLLELKDINERTILMMDLFGVSDNKINNLCLFNVHSSSAKKPTFNFTGLTVDKSHFENYDCLSHCKFDEKTFFNNSQFLGKLVSGNIDLSLDNFETSNCNMTGILKHLSNKNSDSFDLKSKILKCISLFWFNSEFKVMTKEDIERKMKKDSQTLVKLVSLNVIKKTRFTDKKKRNQNSYEISKEFSNLRKVMEENNSCLELENIIKNWN
ncbi:NACHT domain-containing protein [Aliivibrio sp. S3MY1]|uniref:NACHT domain-containing protein n=1 Tax=unclassified Aliivibrio TaxID=2645654 RepID=UPI00237993D9|nr:MULTISPECIES: NACHT domain-containing protein [unclassified Aliivibrio]MDD9194829.1 NACHT domain-containing protein [Aliivibrio sp. S3MY1]MDD9198630.1 NACHT domain-containing protein [Aliivibrio sp. S2MY1]